MPLHRVLPAVTDDRGAIFDLLTHTAIDAVALITSRADTIRGNHYHKQTDQWLYLLEGALEVVTRMPGEPVVAFEMNPGDLLHTPAGKQHAIRSVTESRCLVLTRGPRNGADYESDTFRLETPLIT